jgi:L-aspartate oxidase
LSPADTPDSYDVIVVGGGAAGLHTALVAAEAGGSVALVSRKPLAESSSYWAQGGLAAALAADDTPELHYEDTIKAGRAACRPSMVEVLVAEAPASVRELEERGVPFDREPDGSLALGLEGGHSRRRIVHAGGAATGARITETLTGAVSGQKKIAVLEGCSALALWSDGERCAGVLTDEGDLTAPATVLSTGGAAALWSRTTNPWGSIGAGSVLAHAAGADVADLELCQFHPTALALPGTDFDGTLITEAVRGEGATLLSVGGERFTDELAPRDAVTAAILVQMDADGSDHVLLDLRMLDRERFPNIFETLAKAGLDPGAEPVPISPAAHYEMGGVATDLDGRTSLPGLYAVGECACTGLHGANRLASNSLSECFVVGSRVAGAALSEPAPGEPPARPDWTFTPPTVETREALWKWAGPRRDAEGLEHLLDNPYPLARMIAAGALERRESRGSHLRTDFPEADPNLDEIHIVHGPDGTIRREPWQ